MKKSSVKNNEQPKECVVLTGVSWKIVNLISKNSSGEIETIEELICCDSDGLSRYLAKLLDNAALKSQRAVKTTVPCYLSERGLTFFKRDVDKWFLDLEKSCSTHPQHKQNAK